MNTKRYLNIETTLHDPMIVAEEQSSKHPGAMQWYGWAVPQGLEIESQTPTLVHSYECTWNSYAGGANQGNPSLAMELGHQLKELGKPLSEKDPLNLYYGTREEQARENQPPWWEDPTP